MPELTARDNPLRTASAAALTSAAASALLLAFIISHATAAAEPAGAAIYQKQCASCHGPRGEGVEGEYDKPLVGTLSLDALTRRIVKTMPEGDAEACVGDDAAAVARYIFAEFYSLQAQANQGNAARPRLARLTVPQFRRTVADLVGSFRRGWKGDLGEERGLRIRYNGRHPYKKKNDKKLWVDHRDTVQQVHFHFDNGLPFEDLDPSERLKVDWQGSIIPPETGRYEFLLRTPNGVKLWVNSAQRDDRPLIDGFVVSNNETRELRGEIFLLAGRPHPLRLEWIKAPQEKNAAVELLWKPPHGPLHRLPGRVMAPKSAAKVTVVSTSFPPDDASEGYERGVGISPQWYRAVTEAAVEVAGEVNADLSELAGTEPNDKDRSAKIRSFCEQFVARALRRPLDEPTRELFIDRPFAAAETPDQAAKRVVLLTLLSPSFLYPEARDDQVDSYRVAARLALYLWDSLPDEALLTAAKQGNLTAPENLLAHAQRMIDDPRTKTKLGGFFHHWLELDRAADVTKDADLYPNFSEQTLADLRVSLELFLDDVVWGENSDYRQLLLADYLYLNDRLRELYGYEKKGDAAGHDFARFTPPQSKRSGVITHPYLLTAFAYHDNTSPIHRGVFLTRNIIGRPLKPPPNAIEFEDSKFDPTLTMREKVTAFTRGSACMSCHGTINPLGFSLEHFDAIGRWRETDNQKPVNAASDFTDDEGKTVRLRGPRDVAELAVESPGAQRAFVRQLFQHAVKQDTSVFGPETLPTLEKSFRESNFHIRDLYARIAATAAAHGLK